MSNGTVANLMVELGLDESQFTLGLNNVQTKSETTMQGMQRQSKDAIQAMVQNLNPAITSLQSVNKQWGDISSFPGLNTKPLDDAGKSVKGLADNLNLMNESGVKNFDFIGENAIDFKTSLLDLVPALNEVGFNKLWGVIGGAKGIFDAATEGVDDLYDGFKLTTSVMSIGAGGLPLLASGLAEVGAVSAGTAATISGVGAAMGALGPLALVAAPFVWSMSEHYKEMTAGAKEVEGETKKYTDSLDGLNKKMEQNEGINIKLAGSAEAKANAQQLLVETTNKLGEAQSLQQANSDLILAKQQANMDLEEKQIGIRDQLCDALNRSNDANDKSVNGIWASVAAQLKQVEGTNQVEYAYQRIQSALETYKGGVMDVGTQTELLDLVNQGFYDSMDSNNKTIDAATKSNQTLTESEAKLKEMQTQLGEQVTDYGSRLDTPINKEGEFSKAVEDATTIAGASNQERAENHHEAFTEMIKNNGYYLEKEAELVAATGDNTTAIGTEHQKRYENQHQAYADMETDNKYILKQEATLVSATDKTTAATGVSYKTRAQSNADMYKTVEERTRDYIQKEAEVAKATDKTSQLTSLANGKMSASVDLHYSNMSKQSEISNRKMMENAAKTNASVLGSYQKLGTGMNTNLTSGYSKMEADTKGITGKIIDLLGSTKLANVLTQPVATWGKTTGDGLKSIKEKTESILSGIVSYVSGIKFNPLEVTFAHIKLPHFSMSGSINAKTGEVPTVSVSWYDKGGLFDSPQIIGIAEKRPEFVGAAQDLRSFIKEAVGESLTVKANPALMQNLNRGSSMQAASGDGVVINMTNHFSPKEMTQAQMDYQSYRIRKDIGRRVRV